MEKFNVVTVAYVTGHTASAVNSWANRNNKTVKDGLTVLEVIEFLQAPKRDAGAGKVDEKAAERLRTALQVMGELKPEYTLEG